MQAYVEQDCTIEHNGRTFTSGGAVVTLDRIVAYVGDLWAPDRVGIRTRRLTDWHGNMIGTCVLTSSWSMRSRGTYYTMYQITATVDGRRYTGRGMGEGMICRLRLCK